jgi:ferric-dicitrate binding protein FerR (iron transport regulator)
VNDNILDIAELLILQKERPLTAQEQAIVDRWMMEHPENAALVRQVQDEQWMQSELGTFARYNADNSRKILEARLAKAKPVHRVHFLRTAWLRYAAAIIILFGIGTYLNINNQKEKPDGTTASSEASAKEDVAPGGNRATLTLADGSEIVLDSAANGKLAEQGSVRITKKGSEIIYSNAPLTSHLSPLTYNTMATPRGGQYQLTLPDGSQVWLNAESSITYPTAFTGKERKVSITGEAYFEVAKDKKRPFIVSVAYPPLEGVARSAGGGQTPANGGGVRQASGGGLEIEVLGTHFNVNTYKEEATNNITLLEGSVRLTSHLSPLTSVHTSLTLKPGQQGQWNPNQEKLSLAVNPNIEQAVAWKNGYFNFDGADIRTVMRQLERWYDVEVVYETEPGQRAFDGEIQRNLNLSDLLEGLQKTDIHFRIRGKQLIITR